MQTVAIVGVGLIGASFGLAIRKAGFTGTILGVSSESAIESGLSTGAISAAATLKEAAGEADLIYLAQPVDRIIQTLGTLGPITRKQTLVTDAGSTKTMIVKVAGGCFRYGQFVGGHPMAGKESRGAESADADLFRNRLYVLTPSDTAVPSHFTQTLNSIGANILEMTAADHDTTVALTSHLPQLISTALSAFLSTQTNSNTDRVFGSGLLDMTRLALSPAELWESILATNKQNVLSALDLYSNALSDLRNALDKGEIDLLFKRAAQFSAALRKPAH